MDRAKEGATGRGQKAGNSVLAGGTQSPIAIPREEAKAKGTPPGPLAANVIGAKKRITSKSRKQRADENSGMSAGTIVWNGPVHQKIIGRSETAGTRFLRSSVLDGRGIGAISLLEEPASHLGGGLFLEPLVEQSGDLLAQIGGVGKTGEFVGLQRIAGRGEKKFPGRLGAKLGHNILREAVLKDSERNNHHRVIYTNSDIDHTDLWKSVENEENPAGCCSGCAGDYEDPDWSAWEPDAAEETEFMDDEAERREQDDRDA